MENLFKAFDDGKSQKNHFVIRRNAFERKMQFRYMN